MIFLTTGSVLPFDRLVQAVDGWAAARGRTDVFGQIGETTYPPRQIAWQPLLEPAAFRRRCAEASLIIAHAGIGTMMTALELGKPLIVMPRRAALREHTSDHQMATARNFAVRHGVTVACEERELIMLLDHPGSVNVPVHAAQNGGDLNALITAIRQFIADGCMSPPTFRSSVQPTDVRPT